MKMCPYCTKKIPPDAAKCRYCGGWFINNADEKQKEIDRQKRVERMVQGEEEEESAVTGKHTRYFSVPDQKLVVMCILTFGIYELYWFYKNWQAVKLQERKHIHPIWRAIFAIFYCFSLFKRIITSAADKGYTPKASYLTLSVIYIAVTMLYRLPEPYWLLSILTFVPLVYVNDAIRYINRHLDPQCREVAGLTGKDIIFLIFGVLLWYGAIYDFMHPAQSQVF